jgi:dipeptidyl aminopeptidase/acylaminoacyl peptidase
VSPAGATIAGAPLPECSGPSQFTNEQTVAFAAEGHVWALDPSSGDLSCLWPVTDPGPFIWGPLGDRVLLGGLEVVGGAKAPAHEAGDVQPTVADWGHPVGIAIVFSQEGDSHPRKLLLEEGKIKTLDALPTGSYLDVAYHPSGLALAFVIEADEEQSIWLSTNEGENPKRLVFSHSGTLFTDIEFSPDGQSLFYTAHHPQGFAAVHWVDLSAPGTLEDGWRSIGDLFVRGFVLAPHGSGIAVDTGDSCESSQAVFIDGLTKQHAALPDEKRPTSVLGWLDGRTALVGAGGCGSPLDLFAVDSRRGEQAPLVAGVEDAATRVPAPPAPSTLPKVVEEEVPPGGVG